MCNGLCNKVQYVKQLLYQAELDVLFLQETEIPRVFDHSLLDIDGYVTEYCVSTEKIRTVVYIKNDIAYERRMEKVDTNVLMLDLGNKYDFEQLAGVYRPFKMMANINRLSHFKIQIKELTDFMNTNKNILVCGDFNLDYNKKDVQNYAQSRLYEEWTEATIAFDLVQTIREDTWTRTCQGTVRTSLLDHAYTNAVDMIQEVGVTKMEISDHALITITTKGDVREEKESYFTYTCWKNYSKQKLLEELDKFDFKAMETGTAEQMADKFDQVLGSIRDGLLIEKTVKRRKGDGIYPSHVLQMKRKLKNMHKRAKQAKNADLLSRCRKFEKEIRREVTSSRRNKIRTEANLGPNNLWKAVNIALNKATKTMPNIKTQDGEEMSNDKEKAEAFSQYFKSKIASVSENTHIQQEVYNGRRKIVGLHEDEWITEELVASVIDGLSPKRCEGHDRIPLIFLIDGKEKLLSFVTVMMSKIINNGKVPDQWKVAIVRPLHKKGNRQNIENYRPISNNSSITKIFERLVLSRISEIEKRENCELTGTSQYGFKKNCSTETACLDLQSKIASHCDKGEYVTISSLDLTAAFDVVNIELLMRRLAIMGLPDQLLKVINDWLKDRYFYCEINGKCSALIRLRHGTVQGSILGPILFAMFISPLEDLVDNMVNYADDNYSIGVGETEAESINKCTSQTQIMMDWLNSSGLRINASKTEVCVFSRSNCVIDRVELSEEMIDVKKEIKILGIIFDSKLTWFAQVSKAVQSANKAKQGISIIAKYFSSEELLKMATAYFYSRLYYGAKVWLISTLSARLKKLMWQTSSRMLQIVDKDYVRAHSFMYLHKKYCRATPEMWGNYSTACALHQTMSTQKPHGIVNGLTMNALNNERRPGLLFTRSNVTKMGFNCLSNRVQSVTNRLTINWMDMPKEAFKALCKSSFIKDPLSRN